MVKALVIDVDGVIVGKRLGINFPLPTKQVINVLRSLNKKGIPVVLCTAKFNHAVKEIITQAELHNPHITDGGALIIDPLNDKIIKTHFFNKALARQIVSTAIKNHIYTEVYGVNDYYLQKNHISQFTETRMKILQKEHIAVASILDRLQDIDVIKIINFAHNMEEKRQIEALHKGITEQIHAIWSTHPAMYPTEGMILTIKGVSKKTATQEVFDYLKISLHEALGVGDSLADWNFMSLCKYAGVVGNASNELMTKAKLKGEGNYFFAPSADEDGFLQILDYFKLA
jgi:HAD superfamily hydrolase (TIGR01484 family)